MPKQIMVNWDRLPQIRIDPLTGDSVIISPQRSARLKKNALVAAYQDLPEFLNNCPFCIGNEEETPAELVRVENHKGWLARGFPNLYPMLQIEEQIELGNGFPGFFHPHIKRGLGAHEIIVESPKHNACFSKLSRAEIAAVFWAMGARYYALKGDPRFDFFYAFKNYGPGASQDHPHWQLEARAFAPRVVYEKKKRFKDYYSQNSRCLMCDYLLATEQGGLAVLKTEHFTAFAPFAPHEPYEVIIAPKEHVANFAHQFKDRILSLEFAALVKEVAARVKKVIQWPILGEKWVESSDPPYLFFLYTAPYGEEMGPFHWHLNFVPRTTDKVGHERGLGEDVIPGLPEDNAKILRETGRTIMSAPFFRQK